MATKLVEHYFKIYWFGLLIIVVRMCFLFSSPSIGRSIKRSREEDNFLKYLSYITSSRQDPLCRKSLCLPENSSAESAQRHMNFQDGGEQTPATTTNIANNFIAIPSKWIPSLLLICSIIFHIKTITILTYHCETRLALSISSIGWLYCTSYFSFSL